MLFCTLLVEPVDAVCNLSTLFVQFDTTSHLALVGADILADHYVVLLYFAQLFRLLVQFLLQHLHLLILILDLPFDLLVLPQHAHMQIMQLVTPLDAKLVNLDRILDQLSQSEAHSGAFATGGHGMASSVRALTHELLDHRHIFLLLIHCALISLDRVGKTVALVLDRCVDWTDILDDSEPI